MIAVPSKTCNFCQKKADYVPINVGGNHGVADRNLILRVHYCSSCAAEYVYWSDDGAEASVNLYASVNDKMYRWSTTTGETTARLWYVEKPGYPGTRPNEGLVLLKSFEEHPDLNPENVAEKIRFMLPFL